jgi:hypothetical protein
MKQTVVDFLIENLHLHNDVYFVTKDKRKIIEQAKEMEKEQIIEAWMATDNPLQRMSAEQYYKETYEK